MNNSSKKNKSCAIVPFYNEIDTLPKLIARLESHVDYIICINDGSTDGSEKSIVPSEKIEIISNTNNSGKGISLRKGFKKAIDLGFEKIVTIDADLQHEPESIPKFMKALENYDFIIGNRLHDLAGMPIHRIASNKITSMLLSIRFKQDILDSQCGFRAFNATILNQVLPESHGFEAETEMIIKALRNKLKIGFVPISTIYGDNKSKMRNLAATVGFIKVYFSN